jgi:phage shock protein A
VRRLLRLLLAPAPDPRRAPLVSVPALLDGVRASLAAGIAAAGDERERALLEELLRTADREAERLHRVLARVRLLETRRESAEAQVRVGEALAGISEEIGGLGPDLARGEEQAEELEARAEALARLLDAERKI